MAARNSKRGTNKCHLNVNTCRLNAPHPFSRRLHSLPTFVPRVGPLYSRSANPRVVREHENWHYPPMCVRLVDVRRPIPKVPFKFEACGECTVCAQLELEVSPAVVPWYLVTTASTTDFCVARARVTRHAHRGGLRLACSQMMSCLNVEMFDFCRNHFRYPLHRT